MGKICEKPILKMGDTNLKKNALVLLYLNISRLGILILCLVGVFYLEIQRQHKTFIMSFLKLFKKIFNK